MSDSFWDGFAKRAGAIDTVAKTVANAAKGAPKPVAAAAAAAPKPFKLFRYGKPVQTINPTPAMGKQVPPRPPVTKPAPPPVAQTAKAPAEAAAPTISYSNGGWGNVSHSAVDPAKQQARAAELANKQKTMQATRVKNINKGNNPTSDYMRQGVGSNVV